MSIETEILEQASKVEAIPSEQSSEMNSDAKNIAMIMSLASQNEAIKNDPEVQDLFGFIDKTSNSEQQAKQKTATKDSPNATTEADNETSDANEDEATEKESVLFSKKDADEHNKYDLTTTNGIAQYLKATYGIDKIDKFFKNASEWKNESEKAKEVSNNLNQVNTFLVGLPDPIYNAIEAYYYGRDWKGELDTANQRVNFDISFDDNNAYDVVNHYFPGQFTSEDFEDNTEMSQKAVNIARRNFELDYERRLQERESMNKNLELQSKKIETSASDSMDSLRKSFPGISDSAIKKVEKMLHTGDYKRLFMNEDGTFSKDAAKNIALALYGDSEIKKRERGSAVKQSNKAIESIVSRGADSVRRSSSQPQGAPGIGNDFAKFMSGYVSPNSTYSAKTE